MMKIFLITSAFLFTTSSGMDWGSNGHRIVAQICEWHLSEQAAAATKDVLGKELLAEVANWPDYIKSEKAWKFADSWHYTTVQPHQSVRDMQNVYAKDSKINDATEAISLMIAILKEEEEATSYLENLMEKENAKPLNGSTKATALAFLVHLVGDIHQPLHVGKNNDRGGNNINVLYFKERKTLHGIWDSDIIEHERLSYTEFATFINKLDVEEIQAYQKDAVSDWADESIMSREHIYNTLFDYTDRETGLPSFSWQYQHDNIPIVEERLLLAGVRLAGILNEIYK